MTGISWMWVGVAALLGSTVAYAVFAVRYWNEEPINEDTGRPFDQDRQPDIERLDHLIERRPQSIVRLNDESTP